MSDVLNSPCSCNNMIAVAANCFDTDATQKRVSGVTGAFGSRLVLPTADCASTSPFCVIITTPSKPLWRITASAIVCKAPASVGACVVASVTGSAFSADLPQAVRQHSKTAASSSAVILFMGNTP